MRGKFAQQNFVDVRDMECAQALAQTSQAMKRMAAGTVLEVLCNALDVRHDVVVWVNEVGHELLGMEERPEETWLRIRKGKSLITSAWQV